MPCNHIFHTSCLRSWFQRHQTCPTCRLDILRPTPSTRLPTTPATPVPPTPTRPDQATTSNSTDSTFSPTDVNSQGPSDRNRLPVPGQAFYAQNPLQFQFRPYTFQQQPTTVDEDNRNSNENANNGVPLQNNMNEFLSAFINSAGLGGGIELPTFFSKLIPYSRS